MDSTGCGRTVGRLAADSGVKIGYRARIRKRGLQHPSAASPPTRVPAGKGLVIAHEFTDVESGRTNFGQMLAYLKRHPGVCRTILVENTDRLYRNIKDYGTVDELDVEISRWYSKSRLAGREVADDPVRTVFAPCLLRIPLR